MTRVLSLLIILFSSFRVEAGVPLFSHPKHSEIFAKLDITCNSCHRFDIKSKGFDPLAKNVPAGKVKAGSKYCMECHGPKLGQNFLKSCDKCHGQEAKTSPYHSKKTACLECHKAKDFEHQGLTLQSSRFCLDCHKKMAFQHRSIENFSDTGRAHQIRLEGKNLSCRTCHLIHLESPTKMRLNDQGDVLNFCASCHGQKAEIMIKKFHSPRASKK